MSNDDLAFLNQVLSTSTASTTAPSATSSGAGQTNGVRHSTRDGDQSKKASVPDLTSLQPVLEASKVSASSEEDLQNMSEESIDALLAKLEEADLVTDGIESRLDQLLGELDGMLESLETSNADVVEAKIEETVQEERILKPHDEDIVDGKLVNHKSEQS
jgi:hypothetical protein